MSNDNKEYHILAKELRISVLNLIYKTRSPHIASAFSCVDILVGLYFNILRNIDPGKPEFPERDRFILSKGHACAALYAVLKEKRFLNKNDLEGFAQDGGLLEQHPTRDVKKGIEVTSGSLGHGLSIGSGMAFAARADRKQYKTYVLLSDGELNEGSTWEAAMFAAQHKLDNLIAIVDYNKMQALGFTKDIIELEPMAEKWKAFGWNAWETDGHDIDQLIRIFNSIPDDSGKPAVIIAHTIKGKGVSFMENNLLWHYRAPDEAEYKKALEELA